MTFADLKEQIRSLPTGLRVALGLVVAAGVYTQVAVRATSLRASVPLQEARLQDMRRNAQEILQLRASGATARAMDPASLGELERSAEISGLKSQIASMTQDGADGLSVSLEGASFNRLMAWLDDLRLNRGVGVKRASIEDAGGNGAVNARLVLR